MAVVKAEKQDLLTGVNIGENGKPNRRKVEKLGVRGTV